MAITVDELLQAFQLNALPATTGRGRPSKYAKQAGREFKQLVENAPLAGTSDAAIAANLANKEALSADFLNRARPVQTRMGGPIQTSGAGLPATIQRPRANVIDDIIDIPARQIRNIDSVVKDAPKIIKALPAPAKKEIALIGEAAGDAVKAAGKSSRLAKLAKKMPKGKLGLGLLAAAAIGGGALFSGDDEQPQAPAPVPAQAPRGASKLDNILAGIANASGTIGQDAARMRRDADTRGITTRDAIDRELANVRFQ